VPYPNLGDVQVSRRLYSASDGPLWYSVQAIRSIVQATGRGMRSSTDHCECYILDANFGRLFTEYNDLFPSWWREAIVRGVNHVET
jgi:Rad3-related DNA helicase